jgi:hypothetical protein
MTLKTLPEEWRRLALVLGGEGMQSGLHFGLNLALMTLLPAQEYGAFAFTLVLGGVGLVYIRSLSAQPASAYIARARSARAADFYEGAFGAAALIVSAIMAAVAGAILSIWPTGGAVAGAMTVGLWGLRSHLRTVGFARGRAGAVTIGDAAFAATGLILNALLIGFGEEGLEGALTALAFANIAGIVAMSIARRARLRSDFRRRARAFYLGLAGRLAWSLYAVTATILLGQGVAFLVVAFAGPAAFAPIAAMLAFFAPLRIFSMSLANMLQPEIAKLSATGDEAGWRAMRTNWTVRAVGLALFYGVTSLLVIPHLHIRSAQHQPILFIAASAWALYTTALGYLTPRLLLETRLHFRKIAAITTLGAAVGLGATILLLRCAAPGYAILGSVVGEGVAAVATWMAAGGPLASQRRSRGQRFWPPALLQIARLPK